MNLSQSSSTGIENDCKSDVFNIVPLRYSSADSFYGLLVAAAVLSLATCPVTIFLNALVMVAVKTKQRLQTHPNILLACLALTDLMVGLVVQPLHITETIFLLQGKEFHEFCDIDLAFSVSFIIFFLATIFHLVLINVERYLAIKHTFTHATIITKTRLMVCSVVAWTAAALSYLTILFLTVLLHVLQATILLSIALLQILVYKEARRHEKQILSQQVSVEARAKFKQEKKALKLTTILLLAIVLFFVLPSISFFITFQLFREKLSPNVLILLRQLVRLHMIFNSFLNPIIYSVRKREFRVAFIEFILRKNFQEADDFDKRLFGSSSNAVRQQDGHEGEERERNAEERNVVHADGNHEDNPEDLACGANFDDNNTVAGQNEPVFSSVNSTSEDHGDLRKLKSTRNIILKSPLLLALGLIGKALTSP